MTITFAGMKAAEWIAVSSAVIALCALGVSIWQGHLMRRHNLLSSRPILNFCLYSRPRGPDEKISIALQNCGPGPALIESFELVYKRVRYNLLVREDLHRLVKLWHSETPKAPSAKDYYFYILDAGSVLIPGQEVDILRCEHKEDRQIITEMYSGIFEQMSMKIGYRSLYGTRYEERHEEVIVDCR